MHKFITLERKPGEKMRAYWSRFQAFFEENHIKKNDKLKVDDAIATATDKQCRYGIGSELVLFLHMAHRGLPVKMASILNTKLKHNDVASLKDLILEKAQDVLEELEGSEASVNRMYHRPQQSRPQYNNGYQSRAPQDSRQNYRRDQRSSGATSRHRTPSPAKAPKNPDNYCCLCLKDPQRKHNASTHFLRECTQLPQRERDHLKMIFEKALQKRSLPRDRWPKKIYGPSGAGQSLNVRLMNMVEDFYDLDATGHNDIEEGQDWFADDTESSDHFADSQVTEPDQSKTVSNVHTVNQVH